MIISNGVVTVDCWWCLRHTSNVFMARSYIECENGKASLKLDNDWQDPNFVACFEAMSRLWGDIFFYFCVMGHS